MFMKSLADSLKNRVGAKDTSKLTNKRQYWIKQFLEALNAQIQPPYKPMTPARLGMMLRFVKTEDLGRFFGECKDANHFSKYFWYRFKK